MQSRTPAIITGKLTWLENIFTPFLPPERKGHTRVLTLGSCLPRLKQTMADRKFLEVEIRKGGEDLMLNSLARPPGLS